MKIGIIGSGDVAQSLGKGLIGADYEVMLGTRDTGKKELEKWKKAVGKRGQIGTTTQAASFGDIAVLAVAWHAAEDVLAQIRPELAGKVIIDVTSPIIFHEDAAPELSVGHDMSGGEIVQQSLPDSHVVKSLNFINHDHMSNPHYRDGIPTMFLCGNNESAKQQVATVLADIGWHDVLDLGGIEKSRLLEPLCLLWVEYGVARGTWDHAFSVLGR